MFVFNSRNKRWIGSMGAVLMGAAVVCVPMDVQASGALGSSSQVGISADLEAVEDTSVLEVAMNDIVISEFNLDGYSNLGIVRSEKTLAVMCLARKANGFTSDPEKWKAISRQSTC